MGDHRRVWKQEIVSYLKESGRYRLDGSGRIVGNLTREMRTKVLFQCFRELGQIGHPIASLKNWKERHVAALVAHWEQTDRAASTMQNRLTHLRGLAKAMGRHDFVKPLQHYLTDASRGVRHTTAQEDKGWSAAGLDADRMISTISVYDPVVGMQLRLMHAFFLRREEAVMFKPHRADRGDYIDVEFGTKGGRHRMVPVQTPYQRQVLDSAKAMVKSLNGYVGDNGKTLKQALNRFDYVCRRFGLTRSALGATSHGLRHQGLNDYFESVSGKVSPIRGGALIAQTVEEELKIEKARQLVAEAAGHARLSISGAYLGGQAIIRQNRRAVPSFGSTGNERLDRRLWEMERLVHLQRRQIEGNELSESEQEELTMLTRRALDDVRLGQRIRSAAAGPAGGE